MRSISLLHQAPVSPGTSDSVTSTSSPAGKISIPPSRVKVEIPRVRHSDSRGVACAFLSQPNISRLDGCRHPLLRRTSVQVNLPSRNLQRCNYAVSSGLFRKNPAAPRPRPRRPRHGRPRRPPLSPRSAPGPCPPPSLPPSVPPCLPELPRCTRGPPDHRDIRPPLVHRAARCRPAAVRHGIRPSPAVLGHACPPCPAVDHRTATPFPATEDRRALLVPVVDDHGVRRSSVHRGARGPPEPPLPGSPEPSPPGRPAPPPSGTRPSSSGRRPARPGPRPGAARHRGPRSARPRGCPAAAGS